MDIYLNYKFRNINLLFSHFQSVTVHTDVGDIKIELFCEYCPKACEVR
jgi:Peptidyl-prolyl cis-trans isomerase (rotamase) - cyclophilin family